MNEENRPKNAPDRNHGDHRTAQQEPKFRIRALHTEATVTVHQAYRPGIGLAAARDGRFPPAWSRERMTWVTKPRSRTPSVTRVHRVVLVT
ncbi:DUF4291 family protein [Streptomyces sp. NPDC012616]|uniref:DUF4291 family protein n=1 Tax=Streptomyces sp. NPDC012616 TaxID=3364840 RepID=UPI0036E8055F